jgi:hypothetical protein
MAVAGPEVARARLYPPPKAIDNYGDDECMPADIDLLWQPSAVTREGCRTPLEPVLGFHLVLALRFPKRRPARRLSIILSGGRLVSCVRADRPAGQEAAR